MKARAVVLVVGITAVLAIGGYAAWKASLVRAGVARDRQETAGIERAGKAALSNERPIDPASGSPQWRGASRKGVAPAGSFRTDWDKRPPKELWRVPGGGGFGSCSVVGGKLFVQDKLDGKERVVC